MIAFLLIIGSALLGSIPFGFLIARMRGVDIREHGSGNIGATNVARNLGKTAGAITLILDVLKGLVPALVGTILLESAAWGLILGGTAMLGHSFSPFLGFKGGKGVATSLGFVLGATPMLALGGVLTFILCMMGTRWVSLSSIVAVVMVVVLAAIAGYPPQVTFVLAVLASIIVVRHMENIQRIIEGREPRFKAASDKPKPQPETSSEESNP